MAKIKPIIGLMLLAYEAEKESAELIKPAYNRLVEELRIRGHEVVADNNYVSTENEAIREAKRLKNSEVDVFILMVGTWTNANYGLAAIKILENVPFILYSFNDIGPKMSFKLGGPTFGYTGSIEIKNSLDQMGKKGKFFFIVGSPFEEKTISKIEKICKSSAIVKKLNYSKIGLIGYYTMGMYSATFDPINIKAKFGITIEHIGENILIDEINKVADNDAMETISPRICKCKIMNKNITNQKEVTENGKMYLAYKKLISNYDLDAINTKCDPELSLVYGRCSCMTHSLLNDEGVMTACEGDIHQTISMMILHYLSEKSVMFLDIIGACEENNSLQFQSCGYAPISLATSLSDVKLYNQISMKGKGITQSFILEPGKEVTIYRIDGSYPRGNYSGHIIKGFTSASTHAIKEWPATEIVLDNVNGWEHFTQNCTADHFALVFGDYSEELMIFNKIMNLETVST
jgi:L-fucose isomerase-like protein